MPHDPHPTPTNTSLDGLAKRISSFTTMVLKISETASASFVFAHFLSESLITGILKGSAA